MFVIVRRQTVVLLDIGGDVRSAKPIWSATASANTCTFMIKLTTF